jgi:hypothetical protein
MYLQYNSVCPPCRNWPPPPPPLPQASVYQRRGHTRLRVRGWGVPIRTTGEKLSNLSTLCKVARIRPLKAISTATYLCINCTGTCSRTIVAFSAEHQISVLIISFAGLLARSLICERCWIRTQVFAGGRAVGPKIFLSALVPRSRKSELRLRLHPLLRIVL